MICRLRTRCQTVWANWLAVARSGAGELDASLDHGSASFDLSHPLTPGPSPQMGRGEKEGCERRRPSKLELRGGTPKSYQVPFGIAGLRAYLATRPVSSGR